MQISICLYIRVLRVGRTGCLIVWRRLGIGEFQKLLLSRGDPHFELGLVNDATGVFLHSRKSLLSILKVRFVETTHSVAKALVIEPGVE